MKNGISHDTVAMEWLHKEAGRRSFAVAHNLFEHVGFQSTVGHDDCAKPCGKPIEVVRDDAPVLHKLGIGFHNSTASSSCTPPGAHVAVSPCTDATDTCAAFDAWRATCLDMRINTTSADYHAKCCLANLPEEWRGCAVVWNDERMASNEDASIDPLDKGCHVSVERPKDTLGSDAFFGEASSSFSNASAAVETAVPEMQYLVAFANDTGLAIWSEESARALVLSTDDGIIDSHEDVVDRKASRLRSHVSDVRARVGSIMDRINRISSVHG